jgi:hypothetical protein
MLLFMGTYNEIFIYIKLRSLYGEYKLLLIKEIWMM